MKVTEIPAVPKERDLVRVAAYARVSSDKDAAFHSLEAQTEYYENYVSKYSNWSLVGIYSDNGISGTIVERPEFQRLLHDCREGLIDLVITKSITRFARNTVILLETIRELKYLGIDCYFEKENMHSISPDGELLITLLAMYAEEEARSVSDNMKWKIRKKFENGEPWVSNMLGYRLVDGQMVIIPEEAEVVRGIFNDFLAGMGKQCIANKYSKSNLPCSPIKKWSQTAIYKILRNEKYTGDMMLQKTYRNDFRAKKSYINHGEVRKYFVENNHEPIISRETFKAVQEELKRREDKYCVKASNNSEELSSPFRGMVICGFCSKHYVRKKQKCGKYRTILWLCNSYAKHGKKECPSQKIPESILIEKTKEVLDTEEITRELLLKKMESIYIPEHNHMIYVFKDGTEKDVFWKHVSRSKSWTAEMRKAAGERTKNRHKGKKHE